MGSNQSATTSPINVYGTRDLNNPPQYGPGPSAQYGPISSGPSGQYDQFYNGPSYQYGPGPSAQYGPPPGARPPPRRPRGPPPSRDPYQDQYGPSIQPQSDNPIFSRKKRATMDDIMTYADEDFAFEDEAYMFRQKPKKNPFGNFDPFQDYNSRNGGNGGPIAPQQNPQYYSKAPRNPPAPKTYYYQPPADGSGSQPVFHYDHQTGDLSFPSGDPLPVVAGGYVPPGFGGPSGNPNQGVVFTGQGYGRPY